MRRTWTWLVVGAMGAGGAWLAQGTGLAGLDGPLRASSSEIGYAAGIANDGGVYLPSEYAGFTPPGRGQSFSDSRFGTVITRLTEGGVFHEYATMTPFNSDDTIVAVFTSQGYWLIDRSGNEVISRADLDVPASGRLKWSRHDPNLFYYYRGNRLLHYRVDTRERSVIHEFSQYGSIDDGGGSSDISEDGDHLVVVGDRRYVGLYQISTDTVWPTLDISGFDSESGVDIGPDNHVLVDWTDDSRPDHNGLEIYGREMNLLRRLETTGGHWDTGRDTDGQGIVLTFAWADSSDPAGCERGGLIKTRIGDGEETCVAAGFGGSHVSAVGAHPWVIVSNTDHERGTASAELPGDWAERWRTYDNEILLIKTDGSVVRRLAHHRTRLLGDYWYFPFAVRSASGRFALFNSNMGAQPFPNYSDVYLIDLGASLSTDAPVESQSASPVR